MRFNLSNAKDSALAILDDPPPPNSRSWMWNLNLPKHESSFSIFSQWSFPGGVALVSIQWVRNQPCFHLLGDRPLGLLSLFVFILSIWSLHSFLLLLLHFTCLTISQFDILKFSKNLHFHQSNFCLILLAFAPIVLEYVNTGFIHSNFPFLIYHQIIVFRY